MKKTTVEKKCPTCGQKVKKKLTGYVVMCRRCGNKENILTNDITLLNNYGCAYCHHDKVVIIKREKSE